MVGVLRLISLALASGAVVLGSEKRALLPALLGNVDLNVSACPDIAIGGGGGPACNEGASPTPAPANPALPPAPVPTSSAPAPAPPAPAPPAPAPPAPAPPVSGYPAPTLPKPAPSAPAPPAPLPPAPTASSSCTS